MLIVPECPDHAQYHFGCPACHERHSILQRKFSSANGNRGFRKGHYRRTYGITEEIVAWHMEAQGSACAICARPFEGRSPHVDHDHQTGQFRGLLCGGCNRGLGQFNEDITSLRRAIAYLKVAQKRRGKS